MTCVCVDDDERKKRKRARVFCTLHLQWEGFFEGVFGSMGKTSEPLKTKKSEVRCGRSDHKPVEVFMSLTYIGWSLTPLKQLSNGPIDCRGRPVIEGNIAYMRRGIHRSRIAASVATEHQAKQIPLADIAVP
mmetsp:Transcript_16706/g.27401  ORF Transcript_16706/g.27401 Transcript_16706/m.27401 type:complete len:132 (+) Transcript_16706:1314-1709(+)